MSQENVDAFGESVRTGQQAFNDGDFETAFARLAPDVEWHAGAWVIDAAILRGRSAVIAHFRGVGDSGDWQVEALDFLEAGEGLFVVHQRGHAVGRTTRIEGTMDFFQVWEIGRDGLIVRVREYESKSGALKAVGLEE
jgi:ketosteroid isomerase-like protein